MFSKKLISTLAAILMIGGLSTNAFAELFSVSIGMPIQHTFTSEWSNNGGTIEAESVSGAMVHVKFPIMLGIGYEAYTTSIKSPVNTINDMSLSISMVDVFWMTPIPVVNFTIGAGLGTSTLDCNYTTGEKCSDYYDTGGFASAYQWYAQLGYNFLPFIDAHLSYQNVTAKVKEKSSGNTSSFNGNVIGLGVAFIF